MKLQIDAAVADEDTHALRTALNPVFDTLNSELEGGYGGIMEHLWIHVEMLDYLAKADGSARHPFRFQKRVSGRSHLGLPAMPDTFNVGHFSVRPDFPRLASLPVQDAVCHVLNRIHCASAVLVDKQKKLGGFDANQFRARYLEVCHRLGYAWDT